MPLFKSWTSGEGVFAIWKVEESNGQLRALLKGAFPYDADISRMKAESRRSEYLAVRVLLAEVCGEEKEICHEPSGKPFLADGSFHLSISHTKGYVAIALHPTREVGIDIEQVSGRVLKVADRFMSKEELQGEKEALETYSGGAERSSCLSGFVRKDALPDASAVLRKRQAIRFITCFILILSVRGVLYSAFTLLSPSLR